MSDMLIIGANGQLGKALQAHYPDAGAVDMDELNISDAKQVENYDWSNIKIVLNAAGYTNVDGAETAEGRIAAWQANASAVANLARVAQEKGITLVHVSTDFVFDGSKTTHDENEPFSPLSVYASSKAAGDIAVSLAPNHYVLRSSWVVGDGKNFVRTMLEIGKKGINPEVVSDQVGRLTFTSELVRAIEHLLKEKCVSGTYNLSNGGEPASWADISREIFRLAGYSNTVTGISAEQYAKNKPDAATRPHNSTLSLSKIESTGFSPKDWKEDLKQYIKKELSQ